VKSREDLFSIPISTTDYFDLWWWVVGGCVVGCVGVGQY
jgi:hypothetical protein